MCAIDVVFIRYEVVCLFDLFGFYVCVFFFFSSRRRHTRLVSDWSSDVCSSDLDGKSVDIDGDYTETLARIDSNAEGVGVFGLAF